MNDTVHRIVMIAFEVGFFVFLFLYIRSYRNEAILHRMVKHLEYRLEAISHPETNTYCLYCGVNRFKQPCNSEVDHTKPPSEEGCYCHICGAAPGKPCDAGLHS